MQMVRSSEGSPPSSADALVVDHYPSSKHLGESYDDLPEDKAQRIDLSERSEA